MKNDPNPMVKFGLLNVLYAFAYACRFLRGDHFKGQTEVKVKKGEKVCDTQSQVKVHEDKNDKDSDQKSVLKNDSKSDPKSDLTEDKCIKSDVDILQFLELTLTLSLNLSSDSGNFDSADSAVESAASNVNIHNQWSITPKFTRSVKKDVFEIVKGPTKDLKDFYIMKVLSEMRNGFKIGLKIRKRNRDFQSKFSSEVVKKAVKKLEFYQSWILDYGHEFDLMR